MKTLFNWIQFEIASSHCLDLFAGSGILGFEALSRGAKFVQFIDSGREQALGIKLLLEQLNASEYASISRADGLGYLKNNKRYFDYIFLDPPFQSELLTKSLDIISQNEIYRGASVYLEYPKNQTNKMLEHPALIRWKLKKTTHVGEVRAHLYSVPE